jgi:ureidoacrylate peracid hydrolase
VVWVVSTYGPGAEADWNVFFDFILAGDASRRFRLALTEGRPEHALWSDLDRSPQDILFAKKRLTPFAEPSRSLELPLRARGIEMLLVTGTVTSVCCECTARDAAMRNFKTIMIADANAARSDQEHNATLSVFLQAFGGVIDTDETLRLIAGRDHRSSAGSSPSPQ